VPIHDRIVAPCYLPSIPVLQILHMILWDKRQVFRHKYLPIMEGRESEREKREELQDLVLSITSTIDSGT
jgi:hypothetical protein